MQWSPTHPAVFSSVDGEGRLDFWNINTDTEVGGREAHRLGGGGQQETEKCRPSAGLSLTEGQLVF